MALQSPDSQGLVFPCPPGRAFGAWRMRVSYESADLHLICIWEKLLPEPFLWHWETGKFHWV